jgi:hypothetical protein
MCMYVYVQFKIHMQAHPPGTGTCINLSAMYYSAIISRTYITLGGAFSSWPAILDCRSKFWHYIPRGMSVWMYSVHMHVYECRRPIQITFKSGQGTNLRSTYFNFVIFVYYLVQSSREPVYHAVCYGCNLCFTVLECTKIYILTLLQYHRRGTSSGHPGSLMRSADQYQPVSATQFLIVWARDFIS